MTAHAGETIIEPVNINDPDALKAVVEEGGISDASKADRIASATKRTITQKMDEDPAFYKQFSEMLEETIRDYRDEADFRKGLSQQCRRSGQPHGAQGPRTTGPRKHQRR